MKRQRAGPRASERETRLAVGCPPQEAFYWRFVKNPALDILRFCFNPPPPPQKKKCHWTNSLFFFIYKEREEHFSSEERERETYMIDCMDVRRSRPGPV